MKTAKYRIKIVTFNNGVVKYFAQKKWFLFWEYIDCNGKLVGYAYVNISREKALSCIDKNHSKADKIKTIEFEYIDKTNSDTEKDVQKFYK
ncbi:MAG: hypothetical protein V4547_17105 [Bacteroidota bacterium]